MCAYAPSRSGLTMTRPPFANCPAQAVRCGSVRSRSNVSRQRVAKDTFTSSTSLPCSVVRHLVEERLHLLRSDRDATVGEVSDRVFVGLEGHGSSSTGANWCSPQGTAIAAEVGGTRRADERRGQVEAPMRSDPVSASVDRGVGSRMTFPPT